MTRHHPSSTVLDLTSDEYSTQSDDPIIREPDFIQDSRRVIDDTLEELSALPSEIKLLKKSLHGAFKNVNPATIGTKIDLMAQLAAAIPLNDYALPHFVYRPDMIDMEYVVSTIRRYLGTGEQSTTTITSFSAGRAGPEEMMALQQHVDAATIPLNYTEGFPQLPNGQPFWSKLEFETSEAYSMFISYVSLEGIRQLEDKTMLIYSPRELHENYTLHFWHYRAKAFDLFKVADHQVKRLNRMLKSEDDHYVKAEKILKKVSDWFDTVDLNDKDEVDMDPMKAVAMMEKLVKISRISIGLPANGEAKETVGRRIISPTRVLIDEINNTGSRKADSTEDGFDLLLEEDDDLVDIAQDLIIKRQQLSKPGN